jgi:uncharacterized membrane protein YkvA (DUF1232 family)
MKQNAQAQADSYSRNATPEDAQRIDANLDKMCKGPICKIWDKVTLLWKMVKDPDAPWASKAIAIGSLIYLISPLDAIPDLIPVIGFTDDVGVILAAVAKLAFDLNKYKDKDVH